MTDAPADARAVWFETGTARLILDTAGRLLRANAAATVIIDAGDLFALRAGLRADPGQGRLRPTAR